jgi:acyl-CoA synthetase (AMP-forming)/AMP-acid ligase II
MFLTRKILCLRRKPQLQDVFRYYGCSKDGVIVHSPVELAELTSPLLKTTSLPHFVMKDFMSDTFRNKVAMVDGISRMELTYKQLHDSTYSFAKSLREHYKVKPGDCVAIMAPNHLHYFTSYFGVGLAGATSTCLNPAYTEYEIVHQLEATNTSVFICHPLCLDKVLLATANMKRDVSVISMTEGDKNIGGKDITSIYSLINESINSIDINSFATPKGFDSSETVYTIPFSSGTTGMPKGVMLTHYSIMCNVIQVRPFQGDPLAVEVDGQFGSLLCPLPFFHIYGMVVGMIIPTIVGGKVVLMPAFDLIRYLEIIQEYKITRTLAVPPIVMALAKHPAVSNYDLSSLTHLLSGAAPLGSELQKACQDRLPGLEICQGWGMTELRYHFACRASLERISYFTNLLTH